MAVNLLGGLYPGLYDWRVKVIEPPVLVPSICLTSGVSSRCRATSEVSVCEGEQVVSGVKVTSVTPATEITVFAMACGVDVSGRVVYETVTVTGLVVSEVRVRYQQAGATIPPTVCAGVTVRYQQTAAIECSTEGVTADVAVQTLFTSDGVGFCCGSTR